MPTFQVKMASEAPSPRKTSRAVQQQQETYERFIKDVSAENVGELHLDEGEETRSIRVRLRRAATRLRTEIEIWYADGKVYFKHADTRKRRGRPKKGT